MINKTFASVFIALAIGIFLITSASALSFVGSPTSDHPVNSLTPNSNVSVQLQNNGTEEITVTLLSFINITNFIPSTNDIIITRSNGAIVYSLGQTTPFDISAGSTETLTISTKSVKTELDVFTDSTGVLRATDENGEFAETTLHYFKSFCRAGPGRLDILEISNVDISNQGTGEDSDDDNWFPFDDIEVEIEIDNNGDSDISEDDLQDLIVQIGLINSAGDDVINEFEFINSNDDEQVDIGDLDGGDEETATYTFRLEDVDESLDGSFDFVVKVYEDGNEEEVCVDFAADLPDRNGFAESVSLDRETDEDKFIRFNNVIVNPTELTCGDIATVLVDVANVGDEEAENLDIILNSDQLGINMRETIVGGLEDGDEERVSFSFPIPQNLDNRGYQFSLTSQYEIDEDQKTSDIEESFVVNVIGCNGQPDLDDLGGTPSEELSISATLESDAIAGEELVVQALITNLGSESKSLVLSATDYQEWAETVSVSSRILNLGAGQSSIVTLTFNVKADAPNQNSFTLEVNDQGEITTQEVEFNLEESSNDFALDFEGNTLIWVIGIINVVLIILIIIVVVRLSNR